MTAKSVLRTLKSIARAAAGMAAGLAFCVLLRVA